MAGSGYPVWMVKWGVTPSLCCWPVCDKLNPSAEAYNLWEWPHVGRFSRDFSIYLQWIQEFRDKVVNNCSWGHRCPVTIVTMGIIISREYSYGWHFGVASFDSCWSLVVQTYWSLGEIPGNILIHFYLLKLTRVSLYPL